MLRNLYNLFKTLQRFKMGRTCWWNSIVKKNITDI